MKRRIGNAEMTGLGGGCKSLLLNDGVLSKKHEQICDKAIELYFKNWGGCDYSVGENYFQIGIEPSYQFDELKIIMITKTKENSYIETGKAWGCWGTGIAKKRKYYSDFKYKSKFVKFVDFAADLLANPLPELGRDSRLRQRTN